MNEQHSRKTIPISGMNCASCVLTIEGELKKLEDVEDAQVNFIMKKAIITYAPKKIDVSDLEKKIEDLGYRIPYKKYEDTFEKVLKILKRVKT